MSDLHSQTVAELVPRAGGPDCEVYEYAPKDAGCYGYKAMKVYFRDYRVRPTFVIVIVPPFGGGASQ